MMEDVPEGPSPLQTPCSLPAVSKLLYYNNPLKTSASCWQFITVDHTNIEFLLKLINTLEQFDSTCRVCRVAWWQSPLWVWVGQHAVVGRWPDQSGNLQERQEALSPWDDWAVLHGWGGADDNRGRWIHQGRQLDCHGSWPCTTSVPVWVWLSCRGGAHHWRCRDHRAHS